MLFNTISYLKKKLPNWLFPIVGFLSLIWFLIRVIPKPSRASYPCMRAAAPLASGFVLYITGLLSGLFAYRQARLQLQRGHLARGILFVLASALSLLIVARDSASPSQAAAVINYSPNNPVGEAKGIYPGRVVWVWDADATNENCTNTYNGDGVGDENDDGYFLDKNTDQQVVDKMVSRSLKELTGAATDSAAWDSLFLYFNRKKYGGSSKSYQSGEKIFIKINATSTWGKGQFWGNINDNYDKMENQFYAISETSPQVVLSVLRQLIDAYGVAQENIFVGDPMKYLYNHCYDKWHAEFPDVHYIAQETDKGREGAQPTQNEVIFYSDKHTILDEASDKIYTVLNEADYLINIPVLKAHARAGITLFAKNHFGSQTRSSAEHLHPGLVAPNEGDPTRTDYGLYRVQVDLMMHERLGRNTVLFLVDGLWGAPEAVQAPTKWDISPFNGDWTSSIIVSQDPVAIEAVCFDFLRTEYNGADGKADYPNMGAIDDYLYQAADSTYWPDGIIYDPENDGQIVASLGVHEHWNNATDRQYSRNLGEGEGIEFIFVDQKATAIKPAKTRNRARTFELLKNYPNPFNPKTVLSYQLSVYSSVDLSIYNILGQKVATLVNKTQTPGYYSLEWNAQNFPSGVYICRMTAGGFTDSIKLMLAK